MKTISLNKLDSIGVPTAPVRSRAGRLKPCVRRLAAWLTLASALTQLSFLNPQLSAATFTTTTNINKADRTCDGQDIIINGATVTFDGAHSSNSLLLIHNAVLAHSPCAATETHKLDLTVTNDIAVSSGTFNVEVAGMACAG